MHELIFRWTPNSSENLSVARIVRRKGTRQPVRHNLPISVIAASGRLEGKVLDKSQSGFKILLPADSGLKEKQSVRIVVERQRKVANVVRVESTDDGDLVGLSVKA